MNLMKNMDNGKKERWMMVFIEAVLVIALWCTLFTSDIAWKIIAITTVITYFIIYRILKSKVIADKEHEEYEYERD